MSDLDRRCVLGRGKVRCIVDDIAAFHKQVGSLLLFSRTITITLSLRWKRHLRLSAAELPQRTYFLPSSMHFSLILWSSELLFSESLKYSGLSSKTLNDIFSSAFSLLRTLMKVVSIQSRMERKVLAEFCF